MPSTTHARRAWPLVAVVLAGLLAVPAPASAADPQVLAADAFGRTVTAGLGTADQGGAWSTSGTASSFTVGGGRAVLTPGPGRTLTATLPAVSTTDAEVVATLVLPQLPATGSVYAGLVGRQVGGTSYVGRTVISSTGTVTLSLLAGSTTLGAVRLPVTAAADVPLDLRVEVTGTAPTTVRARAWTTGSTEPASWQLSATDTTPALQAAGSVGLVDYLSSSAAAPLALAFDDLRVTTGGVPAPNQPPTAAFTTTSVSGLTITLDATASTDPDGSVAARTWDLGDGSTAEGTTVTRTYAAAGTYPVTLTVTDDDGATATITRSVTVTAPSSPTTTVAADAFSRAVTGGWGEADQGGRWSVAGSTTGYAVDGSRGTLTSTGGRTLTTSLTGLSTTDADVTVTLGLSRLPSSGASSYTSVLARQTGSGGYAARVVVDSAGSINLYLNGGTTVLAGTRLPVVLAAGDQLRLRVQVTGTNPTELRARAWPAGTPEPTRWTLSSTNTAAALQGPGWLALSQYVSTGATTPVALTVDDLAVTGVASTPARPTQAQWLADVDQAMTGGPEFLDTQVGVAAQPAIVLDVDNTSLQSYYQPFAATPAVLAFAQRARTNGFAVFVVTGRAPDSGATASQLSRAGYVVDGICFRDPAVSPQVSKENCRAVRAEQGYTVVANVGNRDQDLAGANSGRTFKLPDYGFLD